jgi:hypothetical protein
MAALVALLFPPAYRRPSGRSIECSLRPGAARVSRILQPSRYLPRTTPRGGDRSAGSTASARDGRE